jgi:L-aspartate oxidase
VAARVDAVPRDHGGGSGWVAVDLLTLSHNSSDPADRYEPLTCFGAYVLDTASGEVNAMVAKKTILATGRPGADLPAQHQPAGQRRPRGRDGLPGGRPGHRPGVRAVPSHRVLWKNVPRFLITEALRGEGRARERPRRAVHGRLTRAAPWPRATWWPGRFTTSWPQRRACVFLDLSALKPDFIRERFPGVYERCLEHGRRHDQGADPGRAAAHFSCGGVHTDLNGRTNVRHLNAIGETACTGLHGANRLASTSLLECLTSAKFAAAPTPPTSAAGVLSPAGPSPVGEPSTRGGPHPRAPGHAADPAHHVELRRRRPLAKRLTRARRILLELREEIQSFYRGCRLTRRSSSCATPCRPPCWSCTPPPSIPAARAATSSQGRPAPRRHVQVDRVVGRDVALLDVEVLGVVGAVRGVMPPAQVPLPRPQEVEFHGLHPA